jgi:hypothetical protein
MDVTEEVYRTPITMCPSHKRVVTTYDFKGLLIPSVLILTTEEYVCHTIHDVESRVGYSTERLSLVVVTENDVYVLTV